MHPLKYLLSCIFIVFIGGEVKAQATIQVAQTVKGVVYISDSKTVIANASVYYGGSMYGTTTDKDGQFELVAKSPKIPLIVSCVGYYSSTVYYQPGKPLSVYLKPKVEELMMVTIHADATKRKDGMKRKDEVALFISEFLGTSNRALSCTITNLDDIDLFYDKKTEKLTASCNVPIMIENKALGYTISYYLDRFEKTPRQVAFAGNYIFKEGSLPIDDSTRSERERAYQGSRMQFIRSLWNHTLTKNGYKVISATNGQLTEENLISRDSLDDKYMILIKGLTMVNSSSPYVITHLTANEGLIYISKDGYYGTGLRWSGGMGKQRIGDLLPYEYQPAIRPNEMIAMPAVK
ncbi:MAG: carboxypeptidase-like regulatory domain-containing protein [Bacteroidota bacterium]